MRASYFLVFLYFSLPLLGQNPPSKFGEVSMDELTLKRYPADTAASAVILFDKGESSLDDQLRGEYKRHARIKFFSRAAIEEWANRTIYLDREGESLSKLKAVTYNHENALIVQSEMDENSIFRTKFDRWTNQIKFTLPNVKEGSVIEFSYTIRTSASLLPGWQFQYTIPVAWSEYHTNIPRNFSFKKEMRGFLSISEHTSEVDGSVENFIMKNAPAFKEEPYTTNKNDYISRIDFQLSEVFIPGQELHKFDRTWFSIVRGLSSQSDFGTQIKTSGFLRDIVEEVTAGVTDDQKKMEAIYNYVKSNVEWNKTRDAIPDRPFKKVLEEKKGSSSEINLLMVSMLQKAKIKALPVLLSTRDHGLIRLFNPRFNQFNYVICLVKMDDKKILLDATDRGLPMKALPMRCLNGDGLVVSEDEMEWVPLVSMRSRKSITADYQVDENGEIAGQITIATDGIEASEIRSSFKELGEEKYAKDFLDGKTWEVAKTTFENMDNSSQAVKENYSVTVRDHAQNSGSVIYLNPYLCSQLTENIFKPETRLYPVNFGTPFEDIYIAKIGLPENFTMEEVPKPKMLMLPGNAGKFIHSVVLNGKSLSFTSQLIINKPSFNADEYPTLREFYNQIVAKQAEQIVLKKK